jgi:hypothetical protein
MKRYMPFIIFGFLLFVGVGDQVLPGNLGTASTQTRTAMNDFFVNMFPSWRPRTQPYERTERQLREIQTGK